MNRVNFTREQIKTAKSYSILSLLSQNGYYPVRHTARGYLFYSPLRLESNPSFLVDRKNRFFDFGIGVGGDVIHLLCKLRNIGFVEAVRTLLENQDFFLQSPTTMKTALLLVTVKQSMK